MWRCHRRLMALFVLAPLLLSLPARPPITPTAFAAPAAMVPVQGVPAQVSSLRFVPGPAALDTPLPSVVPLSSAGGGTATITVTNVALDGGTSLALDVAPGAPITLSLDYEIRDVACPGCIDQIIVGYAPSSPLACVYDGQPTDLGATGAALVQISAPTAPGLHFVRYDQGQDFGCNLDWWDVNGPPGPNNTVAALYVRPAAPADARDLAYGDVDGDGDQDLALGGNTTQVERLLLNDGGTFRPSGVVLSGPAPTEVALGDADSDGDLDLFAYAASDGSFRWYEQAPGEATWAAHVIEGAATGVNELLVADLNNDARLDLIFSSANDAVRVGAFLNNGTPTVGSWPLLIIQDAELGGVTSLALGDFDGDADLDLVGGALFSLDTGGIYRLYHFRNTGGVWQREDMFGDGQPFNSLAAGDLDGDADRDLLVARSGQSQLWLNDGSGTFRPTSQLLAESLVAGLGDLDGDGDLDGVLAGASGATLWLNDGAALFGQVGDALGSGLSYDISLPDLDNDGDRDLFVADGGPGTSWINTGGNIDASAAQPIGTGSRVVSTITSADAAGWYRITVPEPDATLTISLTGLTENADLYLFAPAINEETGQLRDLGRASALGALDDLGRASALGELTDLGQLGNLGDLADLGTLDDLGRASALGEIDDLGRASALGGQDRQGDLVASSARGGAADEMITFNVRELAGTYAIAVVRPVASTGAPYSLATTITPPAQESEPIYAPLFTAFTTPLTDTSVQTLVIYHPAQLARSYPQDMIDALEAKLATLAAHPQVAGKLVDLSAYQPLADAYSLWNRRPENHLTANFVASQIKSLLYKLGPAYPNLRYLVLVGGDEVIPHRRIRDEALFANERRYADEAGDTRAAAALAKRYFLSDDYYAGLLPLPWRGRELYLPQLGLGRLVETPAEMSTAIDAFLAKPLISPASALVTGYTFVQDQARAISASLAQQGIESVDQLINDSWTAADLRARLFPNGAAPALVSLNAHFDHYRLFPNDPSFVYADETPGQAAYAGSLVFSVGCHAGLNAPDGASYADPRQAADWAQAFLREGATFIGNTGYGYGDSDLIAYSERLMTYFVAELGYNGAGTPGVGQALLRAKQRYFNSLAAGGLSNYDEKILGIATLYGLPMLQVQMPNASAEPPGGRSIVAASGTRLAANGVTSSTISLDFGYSSTSSALGRYDRIVGEDDLQVVAGRPILPRTSRDVSVPGSLAHGVLLTGATFSDSASFDPLIARVVTDEVRLDPEPTFASEGWFPARVASLNRFLNLDGETNDRLVLVPAQFLPTTSTTPTLGIQRRYERLEMVVYHAPFDTTDFVPPTLFGVSSSPTAAGVAVTVAVNDSEGVVGRVALLYRTLDSTRWQLLDLSYSSANGTASGLLPGNGSFEFIVQAVDGAGNVATALDNGQPFAVASLPPDPDTTRFIYAPMLFR